MELGSTRGVHLAVVRRHVLAAIAKAVDAGDVDVARKALGTIDWVVRGRARRRLEAALIDAALATGVLDPDDPDAARHLLRAAALGVRGRPIAAAADRDAIERAYAELAQVAPPRLPLASIAAAAAVLTLTTAVVAASLRADPVVYGPYERPDPPSPVGAYRDGGTPARDPAIEAMLGTAGPVAVDPGVLAPHPELAEAWRAMAAELARYDGDDDATRSARARVQVVSDQFAAANLGYLIDAELHPVRTPVVTAYRVDKVAFVRAGDERIRVLDLRRLTPGGDPRPWLGMKPEGLDDPVVLLDQIDRHVEHELIPVLRGATFELAEDGWGYRGIGRAATRAATRGIRHELAVALGSRPDAAARIRRLLIASVRHHEAQHGLEHGRPPALPDALAAIVGPLRDGRGRPDPQVVRARAELSAYLSQIASDMWIPQVALWSLARHAFRPARRDSAEAIAAVLVIEGLARELDLASPGPARHGGKLDRDRLAALVEPLAAVPTIELRSAAARLWRELYGEPLVRLVDDTFGE